MKRKITGQTLQLAMIISIVIISCKTVSAQKTNNNSPKFTITNTEPKPEIHELKIGDKVPEILFENVLNYKSNKAKLSDFKGKLVILDMWSTWCSSCIAAFPKMQELQNKFKDKLQILLVNPYQQLDPEDRIKKTLNNQKIRTGFYPLLPIPIHDTILNIYFPHESVPHEIWVDGNGKVVGITGSIEVTVGNIESILSGEKVNMPIKNDWAFDKEKPLLVEGNGGSPDDFIYRSILTRYKGGIGFASGVRRDNNNEIIGIYMINKSLRNFVSEAYLDIMNNFVDSRIIFEVKNPVSLKRDFDQSYTYCYDLTVSPGIITEDKRVELTKKYLQDELKRAFNITVRKENRKLKTLIITANDKIVNSYTKSDKATLDLDKNSIKKYLHNFSITDIIKILEGYFEEPLIDETGMDKHIDVDFPDNFDFMDTKTIMDVLRKAGFDIKVEEREVGVVVITDK